VPACHFHVKLQMIPAQAGKIETGTEEPEQYVLTCVPII
jgi:hypothetical protein